MSYSNSQLQSYKNCPLQYRYHWLLRLRSRDDEGSDHHLRFGQAIHAGLERLYLGRPLNEVREAFLDTYPRQLDLNDKAKTRETGLIALRDYIQRWREEDKKWKVIAIENRSDDPWSVKPDLVVEHLEHGGVWLVDHKTTGQYLNYRYWERFEPNSQITHYLDYARERYGPIEGFIINAISFRYRERAYKGEPAGFWCAFERQVFNRNEAQLEHERQSRAHWIQQIKTCEVVNFWPTNTNSCYQCHYRPLCAAGWDWEQDQELIEIGYYQSCGELFGNGEYCILERNHIGDCSGSHIEPPVEFEVEV